MHSSLIGKVEKANRYARELDRISLERVALTFRGDNDPHHVSLDAGKWHCTCHYFESWGSCVHLLALQKIFGVIEDPFKKKDKKKKKKDNDGDKDKKKKKKFLGIF